MDVNFKMDKLEKVKQILNKNNCKYLLDCENILNEQEREEFSNKILEIDFQKQKELFEQTKKIGNSKEDEVKPANVILPENLTLEEKEKYEEAGKEIIKEGKLAIVTLAGGQGTRLGHTGPKGTYKLVEDKSLFEILCDNLKDACKKYDTQINWYIMTSKENHKDTVDFFETHNYFNYPKENIIFFKQNDYPMNLLNGEIFLGDNKKIKTGADGHGGTFDAMLSSGILEDIKKKNIKWIYVTPVDNPLIELVDSLFIGIAETKNYDVLSKSVEKIDPNQKSGVFALKDDKVRVLEYTEISPDLMTKVNNDGNLFLRYAHINCNLFNISAIEKLLKVKIPYHIAKKKATYFNEEGKVIVPETPNAYKYEKFIFDYFPYLKKVGVYNVDRNLEYEPVKSSAENAREAYLNKIGGKK